MRKWHQVIVARSPDQMRPQRHSGQVRTIGLQYQLFGLGLGLRIMGLKVSRIGSRLIDAGHVSPIKDHAGRTGVDQPADAVLAAGQDHVERALDVDPLVGFQSAPDSCLGGDVEDDVAASRALCHGLPRSAMSPWCCSTPRASSSGYRRRDRLQTRSPRASSRRTIAAPRKPPPPVTTAFMVAVSRPRWPASPGKSWRCGGCPPETPDETGSSGWPGCARGELPAPVARAAGASSALDGPASGSQLDAISTGRFCPCESRRPGPSAARRDGR